MNFSKSMKKNFQNLLRNRKQNNFTKKNESVWRNYLNRDNYSELGKKVFDRLKEIWDQEDFLVGSMLYLNTEEKLQKMYDFLIKTGTNDSDDVIPYSLKIDKGLV